MRCARHLVWAVAGAFVLAACGPAAAPSATSTATPVARKVKIVSSFPLQGPQRDTAIPLVNAIKMALEEQDGKAGDTTVEYESYDDASAARQSWDPEVEAENARRAAGDPAVVAYIGTLNSGAARVAVPITCRAGLAMISPANTYPGLTKAYDKDEPAKYYPDCTRNYARVLSPDDVQGTVAARWAKELGAKKVYVLHDTDLYGSVVAEAFRVEARKLGLEEVGYEGARKADDFGALARKIAASAADLVYYGGVSGSNPGFLLRDVKQADPSIKFMAPDGAIDRSLLRQAGREALGTYLTVPGIAVPNYTGKPKAWAEKYRAKHGDDPPFYAVYAYEAAKVVLAAIAKAGQRSHDRTTIRELVMGTKEFDGVLGRWSFDANGDITLRTMSGLKVTKIAETGPWFEFEKELN